MDADISQHQGATRGCTSDHSASVLGQTIDQIMRAAQELALDMVESKDMCKHVLQRLEAIAEEAEKLTPRPPFEAINRYTAILKSYHGFLERHAKKKAVIRLVYNRTIERQNLQYHIDIDNLISGLNVPEGSIVLQGWREQYEGFQKVQQKAFKAMSKDKSKLMDNMRDAQTQSEALSLLLFEVKKVHSGYTESELKIIHDAFTKVAQFSTTKVPSIETWFLPPYEISYDETPFAWGAYGTVHHAKYLGSEAVVKRVQICSEMERAMFMKEANAWFEARHTHVVGLFGAYHVGTQPYFVCAFAANGTLADYLYKDENRCRTWKMLHEAGLGLKYLHLKKRLIHNDMKCNNIVVSGDHKAMITDFGLCSGSSYSRNLSVQKQVGALSWKAPEIVSGTEQSSFASDIYSFAMCIIEAVSHRSPWFDMDIAAVPDRVKNGYLPPRPENMTDEQWELIVQMCALDPKDRLDIQHVVEKLEQFAAFEFNNTPDDEPLKRASLTENQDQAVGQPSCSDPTPPTTPQVTLRRLSLEVQVPQVQG